MSMILLVHTQILIKQLATEKELNSIRSQTGSKREEIQKYWAELAQNFLMKD